jgi:hypothetical protein
LWGLEAIAEYDAVLQRNKTPLTRCATRELDEIAKLLNSTGHTINRGAQTLKNSNILYEVRADNAGVITHIGTSLFSDDMKKNLSFKYSMIFDFIERNNLYLRLLEPVRRNLEASTLGLEYDEKEFFNINSQLGVEIRDIPDERKWMFQWKDQNGNVKCTIKFPKSYSLISGLDMEECQNELETELQHWSAAGNIAKPLVNPEKLVLKNGVYVMEGSYYLIKDFNRNSYYTDSLGKVAVKDAIHPTESLANIFTGVTPSNIVANVTQNKYGLKKTTYKLKLTDLLDFFYAHNCNPYFGVESYNETKAVLALIYENEEFCYNHLLQITVNNPTKVAAGAGTVDIKAYFYIPTHNLKTLFGELEDNKVK